MPDKYPFSLDGAGPKPGRKAAAASLGSKGIRAGLHLGRQRVSGEHRRSLDEEVRKRQLAFEALRVAEEKYHQTWRAMSSGIANAMYASRTDQRLGRPSAMARANASGLTMAIRRGSKKGRLIAN